MANTITEFYCNYDGLRVTKDGVIYAKFKSAFINLSSYITIVNALGHEFVVGIKAEGEDKFSKVGLARLNKIAISREGEATIEIYGDNLNISLLNDSKDKNIIMVLRQIGGAE